MPVLTGLRVCLEAGVLGDVWRIWRGRRACDVGVFGEAGVLGDVGVFEETG